MSSDKYPNYAYWLTLLANRNMGVLAVVFLAAATILILVEVRGLWPRFYPALRNVGFFLYFLLTLASVLIGVASR